MLTSYQRFSLLLLLLLPPLAAAPALANLPDVSPPATAAAPPAGGAAPAFPPFSRYELIIARQPFGRVAAAPVPTLPVPDDSASRQDLAEQQKLAKQINMSGVTINPSGATFIGFTDLSVKPPVNYYLPVGSAGGGWMVLAADYHAETATIEKDGIRIDLKLGKGLVTASPPSPAVTAIGSPLAAVAGRGLPPVARPAVTNREPAFKTVTEQMMGMIASVPLGSTLPPLPIVEGDDLASDSGRALTTPVVIKEDDDAHLVTHKESVALIKEDMRQTIAAEGGTASSYLKRLQARHRAAEQKRKQEAEKLRQMVETAAKEKVLAELAAINARLEEEGISTIQQGEVMLVVEEEDVIGDQ